MSFLRGLTYRSEVITLARRLGLRSILRKGYYWWVRPRDGKLQVELAGISAQFYVRTPEELRMLGKAKSGYWERDVLQFLAEELRPGDVVYDVGGYVGFYTVVLAKSLGASGQVIAFEPETQTCAHLQDNVALNSLSNVRVFQVALGDHSGEANLYCAGEDLLFSNMIRPRSPNASRQVVKVMRGDDFREAENLPVPQAVKIDVEGYEYAVLCGLRRTLSDPSCRIVSCEVHPTLLPPDVRPEQIHELLGSLGFNRIETHRSREIPEYHALASKA
jgi:FkbM family methyltransferase